MRRQWGKREPIVVASYLLRYVCYIIRYYAVSWDYNDFHHSSSKSRSLVAVYKLIMISLAVSVIILETRNIRKHSILRNRKTDVWGAMRMKWAVDPKRCHGQPWQGVSSRKKYLCTIRVRPLFWMSSIGNLWGSGIVCLWVSHQVRLRWAGCTSWSMPVLNCKN